MRVQGVQTDLGLTMLKKNIDMQQTMANQMTQTMQNVSQSINQNQQNNQSTNNNSLRFNQYA